MQVISSSPLQQHTNNNNNNKNDSQTSAAAALAVLTDRSLFLAVAACSAGVPYFVHELKQQLVSFAPTTATDATTDTAETHKRTRSHACSESASASSSSTPLQQAPLPPQQDVERWQRAVCESDKQTLEAFAALHAIPALKSRLALVLDGIVLFALTHSRDLALLEWIVERFAAFSPLTIDDYGALGAQGDAAIVELALRCSTRQRGAASDREYARVAYEAAKAGHLDLVRFMHALTTAKSSSSGDSNDSRYTRTSVGMSTSKRSAFSKTTMDVAAIYGHLAVVQFLHANRTEGCTRFAASGALRNGHADVVAFLRAHRRECQLPHAPTTTATLAGRISHEKHAS